MLRRTLLAMVIVLAACGSDGSSERTTTTVAPVPLVADFEFTYSMESPSPTFCVAVNWVYTDTSTGGPTAWRWDFGNGDTSTEQNPARQTAPGGEVTLTVSRGDEEAAITKNVMASVPVC